MTGHASEEAPTTKREAPPWCNDRGRCKRYPKFDHHGCHGHNDRRGEPCRNGWMCAAHDHSPWGRIMEPFAQVQWFAEQRMDAICATLTDEQLFDLVAACDHLDDTNCWFAAYDARQATRAAARRTLSSRGHAYVRGLMAYFGNEESAT